MGFFFLVITAVISFHLSPSAWAVRPNEEGLSSCSPEVFSSVERFATTVSGIATSSECESGSLTEGSCVIAGLQLDRNCSSWSENGQLRQVIQAIRDVRGRAGLGCLNQMNGALAETMNRLFQRSPPIRICCGSCTGIPDTATMSTGTCAVSFGETSSAPPVVSLGPGLFGAGVCGSQRYAQPVQGTLFHELLHHAGLCGVNHHGGGGVTDPASGRALDERDFAADPVYGCMLSCFGRPEYRSSTQCLACARGVADSPLTERDAGTAARSGGSANPVELQARLRALQGLLADPARSSSIPQACRNLASRPEDGGSLSYRAYTTGIQRLDAAEGGLRTCVSSRMGSTTSATSLNALAGPCQEQAREVQAACDAYEQVTRCNPSYHLPGSLSEMNHTVNRCRSALGPYLTGILRMMNVWRSIPGRQAAFTGFDCATYFPARRFCAGLTSGYGTPPPSLEQCQAAMPTAPSTSP